MLASLNQKAMIKLSGLFVANVDLDLATEPAP